MAWRRPGDKLLSEPVMARLLTHICVTRPQWVNSLWPSDLIYLRSWSTLIQVMAYCLIAPSHYLNQCWLTIKEILWHPFHGNVYLNTQVINPKVMFEIYTFEITATSPRVQWVTLLKHWIYLPVAITRLGLCPANERHCYKITLSLFGWAQT